MALFQPVWVFPDSRNGIGQGTVDANNDLTVSWRVMGASPMKAFEIVIYENNAASTQVYDTTKISLAEDFYGTNALGEPQFFSYTIDAGDHGMANGNEYKLVITQWWGSTDTESVTQASASAFITREAPSLSIDTIGTSGTIDTRFYTFTGNYSQTQGDVLNWLRWQIAVTSESDTPRVIYETGEITGTLELSASYDGFFTGTDYAIMLTVQTENGIEATTGWVPFTVSYATSEVGGLVDAKCASGTNATFVNWKDIGEIVGEAGGDYTLSGGILQLPYGSSVKWGKVSDNPMSFGTPWSVLTRATLKEQNATLFSLDEGNYNIALNYRPSDGTLNLVKSQNEPLVIRSGAPSVTAGDVYTQVTDYVPTESELRKSEIIFADGTIAALDTFKGDTDYFSKRDAVLATGNDFWYVDNAFSYNYYYPICKVNQYYINEWMAFVFPNAGTYRVMGFYEVTVEEPGIYIVNDLDGAVFQTETDVLASKSGIFNTATISAVLTPTTLYLRSDYLGGGVHPSETLYPSTTLYPQVDTVSMTDTYEIALDYTQRPITSVAVYGACDMDYLEIKKGVVSGAVITEIITDGTYEPTSSAGDYFMADFTSDLNASNIDLHGQTLVGYSLYRRKQSENVLVHIADADLSVNGIYDYSVKSQQGPYVYYLFLQGNESYFAEPLVSDPIAPCFWDWSIMECQQSATERNIYNVLSEFRFGKNLESSEMSNNNQPSILKNFTRYPTIQIAPQNYKSGTLTSLIGIIDYSNGGADYSDTIELSDALYELSTTSNPLFLKDRKGRLLRVKVRDAITIKTMDATRKQAQTITIPWVEFGSADGVSLYSLTSVGYEGESRWAVRVNQTDVEIYRVWDAEKSSSILTIE